MDGTVANHRVFFLFRFQLGQSRFAGKAAGVDRYRALYAVTIWELIMIWALGASVAVTVAMVAALAIIFWVSRKLD